MGGVAAEGVGGLVAGLIGVVGTEDARCAEGLQPGRERGGDAGGGGEQGSGWQSGSQQAQRGEGVGGTLDEQCCFSDCSAR